MHHHFNASLRPGDVHHHNISARRHKLWYTATHHTIRKAVHLDGWNDGQWVNDFNSILILSMSFLLFGSLSCCHVGEGNSYNFPFVCGLTFAICHALWWCFLIISPTNFSCVLWQISYNCDIHKSTVILCVHQQFNTQQQVSWVVTYSAAYSLENISSRSRNYASQVAQENDETKT